MYGVSSNASVGRSLENSLDAVLQSTQENLDRVQMHKGSQATAMRASTQRVSTARSESVSARPASAPKARPADVKEDIVMKKLRLLEDKAKKSEVFSNSQHQVVQDLLSQNEKLQENQRADKKIILGLKEQVSSMKTRLELLLNQEVLRDKLSHGQFSPTMDMRRLEEMITLRISQEVAKAMNSSNRGESTEAMRSILQNEAILDKQMQSHANESTKANKHIVDQMVTLEKETLRLKAENDRIKYKQSHLDKIYSELKETVSVRELKQEESYKRLFAQYRSDLETLTRNTTERVHEVLQLFTRQELDVKDLKEEIETHITNTGELLAGFDMRMQTHEEGLTSLQNAISLHKQRDFELEERIKELEAMMSSFIAECEQISALKDALHTQGQSIHRIEQHQQVVDLSIKQIHKSIDQTRQMITTTQLALETLQSSMQGQVESLTKDLAGYQGQYVDSVSILRTSQQKLKSRLKDTEGALLTIQDTKAAMQSLMQELQGKIHEESSHIYETQTSLQRVETRINALQDSLPTTVQEQLQEHRQEVDKIVHEVSSAQDDKREAWTALLLDEINSRLTRFDSSQVAFRTNLDQHVEQLTMQLQALESCLSLQSTTAQHVDKDLQGLKVGQEELGQQMNHILRLTEKKTTEWAILSNRIHSAEDTWTQWRDHLIDKTNKQDQTLQTLLQRLSTWQTWEMEKKEFREEWEEVHRQCKEWMTRPCQVHEAVDTADLLPSTPASPATTSPPPSSSPAPAPTPSPASPALPFPVASRETQRPREEDSGDLGASRDSLADFHAMIEQANHDILALDLASASRSQPRSHGSSVPLSATAAVLFSSSLSSGLAAGPPRGSSSSSSPPRPSRSPQSTSSSLAGAAAVAAVDRSSSSPSPPLPPFPAQSHFPRNRTSPTSRASPWEGSPHMPSKPPDLRRSGSHRMMSLDTGGESDDSLTRLDTVTAPPGAHRWGVHSGPVSTSTHRGAASNLLRPGRGGPQPAQSSVRSVHTRYAVSQAVRLEAEARRAVRSDDEDDEDEDEDRGRDDGFTQAEEAYIQQLMHTPYTGFDEAGEERGEVTLDQILEEDFGG